MIRILLLLLSALSFGCHLEGGIWDNIVDTFKGKTAPPAPSMRILIEHDVERIRLEATGKYSLYDPYTNSHISSRFVPKSRDIQALNDGLKWGEAFPGLYQIKIQPDDQNALIVVDGREYPGSIYIYDIGGTISVVNQITVEDYIRYILAEFPNRSLHPEVLAALAIVARTNAYYMASNPKNTYWAVDASKVNYKGRYPVPREINNAVNATRYMIMSRTGVYEGPTAFPAQIDNFALGAASKEIKPAGISLAEANAMAEKGEHAAQILARAFPGTTIMLMHYSN